MRILDWLFGKDEEEEEPPEFLVLGARLRCAGGSRDSHLYLDAEEISLNHLPEACVADNEALLNILLFGTCFSGTPCERTMKIKKEWENLKPQTKRINGKEVIMTESTLQCEAFGMLIEAMDSGQDGVYLKEQMLLLELHDKYPELMTLVEEPYGSVYLTKGMYQQAIQFLEERIGENGGVIRYYKNGKYIDKIGSQIVSFGKQ